MLFEEAVCQSQVGHACLQAACQKDGVLQDQCINDMQGVSQHLKVYPSVWIGVESGTPWIVSI